MITRLLSAAILASLFACQVNPLVCPTPEVVKLRRAKAHRMKYMMAKMKEAQATNSVDYFQQSAHKTKELKNVEEWDCPKPGLKHDKMVQKKARDLQRRYARNLKKVAKESEERTVTYTSPEQGRND
ncbi:MAG TPA: hypothetical protein P5280_07755 [Cyclobacteriaceae bacterium]|nr:hypothetical protein [Cyclobacteriaceae bacterium]